MTILLSILGGIIILIIIAVVFIIGIYNKVVRLKNQFENAWSQIKVQLNRRHDLIPNLVNAVKGYMKHERETLENVIKARNMAANSQSINDSIKNENMLSSTLKSLFAVMESYPDLKANQNVMELQEELTSTENRIAFARQHYNDSVMMYNTHIQSFPANVIAGSFNFKAQDFFEPDNEEEIKKVPKVEF